ncbi:MAG: hypothetical protein AB8I08_38785 [Sandaracinaceae bacterium]
MTGYRVATEAEDPFAVDRVLVQKQRFRQQVVMHTGLSVVTLGIWLPVLVWALLSGAARKLADGYEVRIRGGILTVGNASTSTSIPLETIERVSLRDGVLTLVQRAASAKAAGAQTTVLGLLDPAAASEAILEAREDHVRRIHAGGRQPAVETVEAVVPPERRRA